MSTLKLLELNTIYHESHIYLRSYLQNAQQKTTGELDLYILDDSIKDIKTVSDSLEPVTSRLVSSFEVTYDGFIYENGITPFDRDPFIIWGRVAIINRLYIYPQHRRKGYGKQTLNQLIKMLRDVYQADFIILKPYPLFGTADLSVTEEVPTKRVIANQIQSLVSFYEAFGFRTQKVDKQYYQCLCLLDYIYV